MQNFLSFLKLLYAYMYISYLSNHPLIHQAISPPTHQLTCLATYPPARLPTQPASHQFIYFIPSINTLTLAAFSNISFFYETNVFTCLDVLSPSLEKYWWKTVRGR